MQKVEADKYWAEVIAGIHPRPGGLHPRDEREKEFMIYKVRHRLTTITCNGMMANLLYVENLPLQAILSALEATYWEVDYAVAILIEKCNDLVPIDRERMCLE